MAYIAESERYNVPAVPYAGTSKYDPNAPQMSPPKPAGHGVPRRNRLDLMTEAERAIHAAMQAVERAGCDTRLTDAVCLLAQAKDRVADYVDEVL